MSSFFNNVVILYYYIIWVDIKVVIIQKNVIKIISMQYWGNLINDDEKWF